MFIGAKSGRRLCQFWLLIYFTLKLQTSGEQEFFCIIDYLLIDNDI